VRTWDTDPVWQVTRRSDGRWQAQPGATAVRYETLVLPYEGGTTGRGRALQAWQRALPLPPDGLLLSNTWGDRSRADRISEAFMLAEINRAAEVGVEVVQLD